MLYHQNDKFDQKTTFPLTSPYFLSLSSDKSPTSWKNELKKKRLKIWEKISLIDFDIKLIIMIITYSLSRVRHSTSSLVAITLAVLMSVFKRAWHIYYLYSFWYHLWFLFILMSNHIGRLHVRLQEGLTQQSYYQKNCVHHDHHNHHHDFHQRHHGYLCALLII